MLERDSEGFSGAEIGQALYEAHASGSALSTELIAAELKHRRPLSVTMGERIEALRAWAAERTAGELTHDSQS